MAAPLSSRRLGDLWSPKVTEGTTAPTRETRPSTSNWHQLAQSRLDILAGRLTLYPICSRQADDKQVSFLFRFTRKGKIDKERCRIGPLIKRPSNRTGMQQTVKVKTDIYCSTWCFILFKKNVSLASIVLLYISKMFI